MNNDDIRRLVQQYNVTIPAAANAALKDIPGSQRDSQGRAYPCERIAVLNPPATNATVERIPRTPFGNYTTSAANAIIVNGSIRNQPKMNSGGNARGPYYGANSVIGRTLTLMSKAVDNLHNGANTFSSLGSNLQHNNLCFAENEENLPQGWLPLSRQLGYKPVDSVVTPQAYEAKEQSHG